MGRKVLAVVFDKHPERAETMSSHLKSFGIQTRIYTQPSDLHESIREISIIVISDLADHGEYVRVLQTKSKNEKLPPMFATVPFITLANQKEFLHSDITAFFTVPIRRDRIMDVLVQHLDLDVVDSRPSASVSSDAASSDNLNGKYKSVPLRVLTVDDNKVNILVAQKFLKRENIQTDVAYDGLAAIAKVQETEYDLILMDVQMPKLDGVAATKRIRELYETPEYRDRSPLQIIALTANAIVGDRERYIASGMNN